MTGELDEIWGLYADDGALSLDAMETALARLKVAPQDGEAVASLFRAMHTFKGNSRILGLGVIEALAHTAEDLIGMVRDDGVALDSELSDILLESVDVLRGMQEQAVAHQADAAPGRSTELLQRMRAAQAARQAASALQPALGGVVETLPPLADDDTFEDAMVFDAAAAASGFADDPLYREIFFDLVRPAMATITNRSDPLDAQSRGAIADELALVRDAAVRIGMPHWPDLIDVATSTLEEPEAFASAVAAMQQALDEAAPCVPGATQAEGEVPPHVYAALQVLFSDDAGPGAVAEKAAALESINVWASNAGFPGICDACAAVASAASEHETSRHLYTLADGIARIEGAAPSPAAEALEAWCGRRADATLQALGQLLTGSSPIDWTAVLDQLQSFSAACRHFGWATSLEVTHVLADICARVRDGELAADPVLTRLLAAYTEAARAMAQANAEPRSIDLGALEKILADTASAAGSLCGAGFEAIAELEELPEGLRNTLSPESAAAIRLALAGGQQLHVVRADVADDAGLAEAFASWLTASGTSSLACATVFEDARTTFDFLLATQQAGHEIDAAFLAIDASGLRLRRSLTLAGTPPQDRHRAEPDAVADEIAARLQEAIGELAVARSCVRQTLGDYIEADLPAAIDQILAGAGGQGCDARAAVARLMEDWQEKLRQLMQVEIQATTEFARLEDLAAQMKPANQTTSVVDGMVVRVHGHNYVLPIGAIERIITLDPARVLGVSAAAGQSVVRLDNDAVVPLVTLNGADRTPGSDAQTLLVMVARTPDGEVALSIDELVGQQSVFSKPLHGYLGGLRAVSGYAVLNSGDVGMLLDVAKLKCAA